MANVNYSIQEKRVFVRYTDIVTEAKSMTADELIAAANEAIAEKTESGEEAITLPEIAELRSLKTRIGIIANEETVESGSESGEEAKYVLVASLRYMTAADESESL